MENSGIFCVHKCKPWELPSTLLVHQQWDIRTLTVSMSQVKIGVVCGINDGDAISWFRSKALAVEQVAPTEVWLVSTMNGSKDGRRSARLVASAFPAFSRTKLEE